MDVLDGKLAVLQRELEATGGVMVAFSGGADSAFLRAEALLRSFGLAQLRVRDHGDLARVEVPVDALPDLVRPDRRARLVTGLHELGFTYVTLDLEGFRSGSMNALLGDQAP